MDLGVTYSVQRQLKILPCERDKHSKGAPPQASKPDVAPVNNVGKEADIPHSEDELIDKLLHKHKNFFIEEGKTKRQMAKFPIGEDLAPALQPQRRIPYQMRKTTSKELEKLKALDIIIARYNNR